MVQHRRLVQQIKKTSSPLYVGPTCHCKKKLPSFLSFLCPHSVVERLLTICRGRAMAHMVVDWYGEGEGMWVELVSSFLWIERGIFSIEKNRDPKIN